MGHREILKTHRAGCLRVAVLGANDGIGSTASLVLGVAAAGAGTQGLLFKATSLQSWSRAIRGPSGTYFRTRANRRDGRTYWFLVIRHMWRLCQVWRMPLMASRPLSPSPFWFAS